MVVFFNFSPTLNHIHPLQVENCGSNSRLVVDEYDNVKSGLKGLNIKFCKYFCSNYTTMSNFYPLEVASPSSETQL